MIDMGMWTGEFKVSVAHVEMSFAQAEEGVRICDRRLYRYYAVE